MNDIDKYISGFPNDVQLKLQQIRQAIKKAAPKAEEIISYKMPAYRLNGMLVYFAGYKNHIGFYPTSTGIENFKEEFSGYKWSKGAVQFPHDKKLPLTLISKIVKFKVRVNSEKIKNKK